MTAFLPLFLIVEKHEMVKDAVFFYWTRAQYFLLFMNGWNINTATAAVTLCAWMNHAYIQIDSFMSIKVSIWSVGRIKINHCFTKNWNVSAKRSDVIMYLTYNFT